VLKFKRKFRRQRVDLTISFQGASYISWYTSPNLNTTEVKDPSGTLLGCSPQPPKTEI
jgi:hypothetical protein